MKIKALVLCGALLTCLTTFASPTDKSLEELSKVQPYEVVFYDMILTPLNAERMALTENLLRSNNLTDEQRKKALEIYDAYAEGLLKTLDTPQVRSSLKKAYLQAAKSNYTQAEVDAQIAFYGSTDGQNALKKQETVFETYLKSVGTANQKTIKNYDDKHLKKMQDDIKKILKQ